MAEEKKLTKQEEKDLLAAMPSDSDRVLYHYQHGQGSIQDIARVYRMSVDEVLHIIGEDSMTTVHTEGDLISEAEKGQAGTPMNYGQTFNVPYDLS